MTLTNTQRQALSRYRKAHNLVQIIAWVPAAVADDAIQAVQDVTDKHHRPELPLPSWAKPLHPTTMRDNMQKIMDAQIKARSVKDTITNKEPGHDT